MTDTRFTSTRRLRSVFFIFWVYPFVAHLKYILHECLTSFLALAPDHKYVRPLKKKIVLAGSRSVPVIFPEVYFALVAIVVREVSLAVLFTT